MLEGLQAGLRLISEVGGTQEDDRTTIDALAPALKALPECVDATVEISKYKAGRAAYLPEEKLRGKNDPVAEAVALLFEGLASGKFRFTLVSTVGAAWITRNL